MNADSKIRSTIPLPLFGQTGLGIGTMTFNNDRDRFVLNNPVFYIVSLHSEDNKAMVTNSINSVIFSDLQRVILEVDQSSHTSFEKEEIKKIVMQFANEVHSKPLGSIISNLKDKFKPYFHVASPYLQMLFSYFLRTQ